MSSLNLSRLRAGRPEHRSARVFRNWCAACAHMCDHLLTWPESEAWVDLLPILAPIIAEDRVYVVAKAMWKQQGVGAQELYDEWVAVLRRSADAGAKLNWVWHEIEDAVYFSPLGIKLVTTRWVVKTAYVPLPTTPVTPGGDEPEEGEALPEHRQRNPLPRQGKYRPQERIHPRDRNRSKKCDGARIRAFRRFRRAAVWVRQSMFLAAKTGMGPRGEALQEFRRAIRSMDHWIRLHDNDGYQP